MSAEGVLLDQRISALMMEAAEWRLLARLFECPSAEWADDIRQLSSEVRNDDLRAAVELASRESPAPAQYHSLFGPGGPAPPREATYRDTLELGSLMSELAGYYDAFGYAPSTSEPPDHVAIEAGFVAYLKLKEAYAVANAEWDHAAVTAAASARFRADHLANVAAPLARILEGSSVGYLARAASTLATRVGPPPRSGRLPMAQPADGDDESFDCGA
jgi:nitrate reductase assembly molybdenum cofactor insertion protein NarJ